MINDIDEKKLEKHGNVKLFYFSGARINDMNHHLMPIIAKWPDYLVLNIGTNDSTTSTPRKIIEDLLMLKFNIFKQLPNCRVIVSKPTVQIDHGNANLTLLNVNKNLETLNLECIGKCNISAQHLGGKGLHLNSKGRGRLALNFLNQTRKFWRPVEHLTLFPNNQSEEDERKVSGKLKSPPSDLKSIEMITAFANSN